MNNVSNIHDLVIEEPIMLWDEALPLGSGLCGCLVWGNGNPLRFSLDRGDLWDRRVAAETLAPDYTYANLIELVKQRNGDELYKRFEKFYTDKTPTKIPAGRLELDYGRPADQVCNRVCIYDALAEITLTFGEKSSHVKTFLHATEQIGFISIIGNAPLPRPRIVTPAYKPSDNEEEARASIVEDIKVSSLGYPESVLGEGEDLLWYRQKTCTDFEFSIVMAYRVSGEIMEIAYAIITNEDEEDAFETAKQKVRNAVDLGFRQAHAAHAGWWEAFWKKSSLTLPDPEMERQWYHTNYLFGSCSRKGFLPTPLQGVWTADEGGLPPWKGDYHNDLNTQMSYWHYMKANHLEEGASFCDFLWNLVPQARQFAADFFDAPGICLPSVMSIDGKPLGGWAMFSTNLINQVWLCQSFDHYWRYTGDMDFLRDKAYVYLTETARCLRRWLTPNEEGKLLLPLSSSPEYHDNRWEAWLTPNSNNDLALMIYLFETLLEMAEQLDYRSDADEWRNVLKRLPELTVNKDNVLMLSPDESITESHRHLAHAMAIYPLHLLRYDRSERERIIIDATINQLEVLGSGWWVGFSFPWMANLYAKQGNGEGAWYQLKLFWDSCCSINGFNLNGDFKKRGVTSLHYRPFTLEANFGAADALQEMLLQNHDGLIRVFPAIPDEWRRKGVAFRDFRGGGGSLVSASMGKGDLQFIELKAERDGRYRVRNDFAHEQLLLDITDNQQSILVRRGEPIAIMMKAGQSCIITGES